KDSTAAEIRITNSQKCLRTTDIANVGVTSRHHTLFEMLDLGSGPCGPCTEIYYDRGEEYDPEKIGFELFKKDIENNRFIEVWNIVFSEYNNDGSNNYSKLARKNIDTGAGLERLACISQNVPTNFETDLFIETIKIIESKSKYKYSSFPKSRQEILRTQAFRIIVDHLRAAIFAIADGVNPSGKDRGYILKKLIRRIFTSFAFLETQENVLDEIIKSQIKVLKSGYSYLYSFQNKILKTFDTKELFNLVETYGLPKEFIDDFRNSDFDKFQFLAKLTQQNDALLNLKLNSVFLYDQSSTLSKVIRIFDENFQDVSKTSKGFYFLVLDKTPFYATSGGQIHDSGKINGQKILDVFKASNGQHVHKIELDDKIEIKIEQLVDCQIDVKSRYKVTAAHSAEHLLHEALKSVVDKNIKQEGAFKSSEKLTFDFYHYEKLTSEQIFNLESHITNVINSKIDSEVLFVTLEEAIEMGAIALFEEKYKKIEGNLRVVKIGGVSTELCGGTHVKNTQEIEKFMIVKLESKGSETGTNKIQECVANLKIKEIRSQKFQDQLLVISNILKSGQNVLREFEAALKVAFDIYQRAIIENENSKILVEVEKLKNLFNKDQQYQEFIITNNLDTKIIHKALGELVNENELKAFIIINIGVNDIKYFAVQNQNTKTFDCQSLIKALNEASNGKGGGKFNFAQGGTSNLDSVEKLVTIINERNLN
uniref:Alanine--tRNA ligase n=1 Tax=Gouania willdenowi TaxID=441366 RepID=A0A8C5GQN2_GOUWI